MLCEVRQLDQLCKLETCFHFGSLRPDPYCASKTSHVDPRKYFSDFQLPKLLILYDQVTAPRMFFTFDNSCQSKCLPFEFLAPTLLKQLVIVSLQQSTKLEETLFNRYLSI